MIGKNLFFGGTAFWSGGHLGHKSGLSLLVVRVDGHFQIAEMNGEKIVIRSKGMYCTEKRRLVHTPIVAVIGSQRIGQFQHVPLLHGTRHQGNLTPNPCLVRHENAFPDLPQNKRDDHGHNCSQQPFHLDSITTPDLPLQISPMRYDFTPWREAASWILGTDFASTINTMPMPMLNTRCISSSLMPPPCCNSLKIGNTSHAP